MAIGAVLIGPEVAGSLLKSMMSVASTGIAKPFHPLMRAVDYMTMKDVLVRCQKQQIPD
jgi:hypothetical protein